MEEKTLRKIAILSSLAGLILLFFISQNLEFSETKIGAISIDEVGRTVKICGIIKDKFVSKKENTFFNLREYYGKNEIKVVIFKNIAKIIKLKYNIDVPQLKNSGSVCVIGAVSEYNGAIEVIAKALTQ